MEQKLTFYQHQHLNQQGLCEFTNMLYKEDELAWEASAEETIGGTYLIYNQNHQQIDTAKKQEEALEKLWNMTQEKEKQSQLEKFS